MDVVVTVPKAQWREWLEEGDLARGQTPAAWDGENEYGFIVPARPRVSPGERCYIVAHGRVRGYAPVLAVEKGAERFGGKPGMFAIVRQGDAVACTIPGTAVGFQGFRYRWWPRHIEIAFPDWQTYGLK